MNSIKRGSVTVQIYPTPTVIDGKRYPAHSVIWHFDGKAYRRKFGKKNSLSRATAFAESKAAELATGAAAVLKLTDADAASLARAQQILKPLGIPLESAIAQFAEDHAAKQKKKVFPYFSEVADKFVARKKTDGTRTLHLQAICCRIAALKPQFAYRMSDITSAAINAALDELQRKESWGNRTRNAYRSILSNCFNYAKSNGYLPRDWHEFEYVPKLDERDGPVTIYTPADAKALLSRAPANMLPALTLLLFCGIRPSEVIGNRKDGRKGIDWRDVNLETGQVFIAEGKVRTAGQRFAYLPPNAVNWLRPRVRKSGRIAPRLRDYEFAAELMAIAKDAGLTWKRNAPRHSYISYRLALTKDIARVSEETGTSPVTLRRRYSRPVAEAVALEYFAVNPPFIFSKTVPKNENGEVISASTIDTSVVFRSVTQAP